MTLSVMAETHIDISQQTSKSVEMIDPATVDIVITLGDEDLCPDSMRNAEQLRWSMPNPLKGQHRSDQDALREQFRRVREQIRGKLRDHDHKLTWVAPASYLNWRARIDDRPLTERSEVPIYSDSTRLRGALDVDLGPYRLQHGLPADERDPALVLMVDGHLTTGDMLRMDKTNTDGFTGAWLADEIAALCSLEMGIRLMAGAPTRFLSGADRWTITGDRNRPTFFRSSGSRRPIIPGVTEREQLLVVLLSMLPNLTSEQARSLVRAARSYRDALWIVESEPELAWLLLISALEVAAVQQQVEKAPIDVLRATKPELVAQLDDAAIEAVAKEFERELGATDRFVELAKRFMPNPPEQRPPVGFQMDWTESAMERRFRKVYRIRSLALHEGIPFPPPMCDPPSQSLSDVWSENVTGIAAASTGGVWKKDDLPFSLHMFEYVTRGILLNWWRALAGVDDASA